MKRCAASATAWTVWANQDRPRRWPVPNGSRPKASTGWCIFRLQGLSGTLMVEGKEWNLNMAAMGVALSDADLAAVLTYMRSFLGQQGRRSHGRRRQENPRRHRRPSAAHERRPDEGHARIVLKSDVAADVRSMDPRWGLIQEETLAVRPGRSADWQSAVSRIGNPLTVAFHSRTNSFKSNHLHQAFLKRLKSISKRLFDGASSRRLLHWNGFWKVRQRPRIFAVLSNLLWPPRLLRGIPWGSNPFIIRHSVGLPSNLDGFQSNDVWIAFRDGVQHFRWRLGI